MHLHPAIVELALRVKGKDRIILVTDAMRAKCMADGCYDLGGQTVHVKQGEAQLADGTLAGSVLRMSSAIRNFLEFTGCDLIDAVKNGFGKSCQGTWDFSSQRQYCNTERCRPGSPG